MRSRSKLHKHETIVPNVIFTSPEIGTAGLSEDDAKKQNRAVKTGKFRFAGLGKGAGGRRDDRFREMDCRCNDGSIARGGGGGSARNGFDCRGGSGDSKRTYGARTGPRRFTPIQPSAKSGWKRRTPCMANASTPRQNQKHALSKMITGHFLSVINNQRTATFVLHNPNWRLWLCKSKDLNND